MVQMIYGPDDELQTRGFSSMLGVAKAGEVWCSMTPTPNGKELKMYAMIVAVDGYLHAVIQSDSGLVALKPNSGYEKWRKVPCSKIVLVP